MLDNYGSFGTDLKGLAPDVFLRHVLDLNVRIHVTAAALGGLIMILSVRLAGGWVALFVLALQSRLADNVEFRVTRGIIEHLGRVVALVRLVTDCVAFRRTRIALLLLMLQSGDVSIDQCIWRGPIDVDTLRHI